MNILITTPRLMLRPLETADAGAFFAYRSLPEVYIYQLWNPMYEEEALSFISEQDGLEPDTPGTWYQLGITLRDGGTLIGDCGLHFTAVDGRQVEVGITLAPDGQGKGFAAETLTAIFDYLFDGIGKHRVYASVDPRNLHSLALMHRMGMRQEGLFLKSVWCRGEWTDDVMFAILEEEWTTRSGR